MQVSAYDHDAEEKKQRLSHRHFKRLEAIADQAGYINKALLVRKQHLQMQRYKVRLQKKRTELLLQQAVELKTLKLKLKRAQLYG
ncbi:hypothetical protein [Dyadobacter sp. Leaf189]|uniref:hypothetical protein n=1 Tax=Dyadobacter sp. Leaf189 TaxID=1736295 RepID=UPI0012FCE620|nr:hypothetical protein [Dyadobacter sp. Leaf189]